MEFHSHNEAETEAIGARLAAVLNPGAVVAYLGDLGMGKTAFTRGLAAGLGYKGRVTSPTFAIVNEYEGGRLPLFHFDMYRLNSADDLFDIGWEDYFSWRPPPRRYPPPYPKTDAFWPPAIRIPV